MNNYPENRNILPSPESAEAFPGALVEFEALTSPEGIAAESQRLYAQMSPFLDEHDKWDNSKADAFNAFMVRKGIEFEEAGNQEEAAMAQSVRHQLYETEKDYGRYKALQQETPHVGIRMNDPRGQAILRDGEAAPRRSDKQIFIAPEDSRFRNAYQHQAQRLYMGDTNTQQRNVASIAVDRIVTVTAPFDSWTSGYRAGRKKEDGSSKESSSADLIKDYASRSTEIPALDQVRGFITTDGALYYGVTGGAHRAAAAILKGQERIETKEIVFQKIDMTSADIESYTLIK